MKSQIEVVVLVATIDAVAMVRGFADDPQPFHPGFGIAFLPAPHCRAARIGAPRYLQHRQAVRREQDDLGALDVLQRPVPIVNDRRQTGAILRADDDADVLGHFRRIAHPGRPVNRPCVSMH